jgi:peptidoglycan/xylan/chitin deacetylase (PgdA/CDA1 family)
MNSYGLRNLFPRLFPRLTWRRANVSKTIYLTFDDGPVAGVTEWVLDVLKGKNVKATFFVVGDNVKKCPELMRRVADEQAYANHTFHHVKGWSYALAEYLEDVKLCDEAMAEVTGHAVSSKNSKPLFRPPYGRITGKQVDALVLNYELIMWDVLTGDYDKHLNIEKASSYFMTAKRRRSK